MKGKGHVCVYINIGGGVERERDRTSERKELTTDPGLNNTWILYICFYLSMFSSQQLSIFLYIINHSFQTDNTWCVLFSVLTFITMHFFKICKHFEANSSENIFFDIDNCQYVIDRILFVVINFERDNFIAALLCEKNVSKCLELNVIIKLIEME